ncbi:Carbon-nitrogen hydrolase [Tenacibaculum sp. MAR_2009_124]|uniref:amidohydrolase n=1 Tax=Tenacibaculum sp. MAR_2009_124 TaxID=1250059 RepID=UPI000897446E|nr:amidohydrolase [Tenacibaculum sp. MAR_2009_124]SEC52079.1 Carbon-nitrogen hydrolase [Tenacibaculum sp. MAR_2009_124]
MTAKLNVALMQIDLFWEDRQSNLHAIREKVYSLPEHIDLIILPEMFTTGFTMDPAKNAESMSGETVTWMRKLAKERNTAITGSVVIKEISKNLKETRYYNRLLFAHPNGNIEHYDKKHTFTLAGEHEVYTAGKERILVQYKGWKICPLICYDLRFPVWARNTDDYDLLFYVANWPESRISAWDALLKSRAIENMSYTIGVNRVGRDANDHNYVGHSACFDALGNCLSKDINGKESTLIVTLEKETQDLLRKKFNFLADRDGFRLSGINGIMI